MKTIEEKAKAYDEIIERAKTMLAAGEVMYGKENNASQLITDLIPELRESEDERIRKAIIAGIKRCANAGSIFGTVINNEGVNYHDVLAYLEKQKEHVPENEESGTRKEQKPTSFNEPYNPDEYEVVMEGNATSLKRKERKPYCPSNDELEKAAKEFREKNVPPIEPISDELVEIIKDEFEGFRTLLKKKGIDYEPQRGYWEGFARLFDSSAREYVKEQKPAWSEEDQLNLNWVIAILNGEPCDLDIQLESLISWLKSLRPDSYKNCNSRWKPSEEQMEALHKAIKKAYHDYDARPLESLYSDLLKQL